MSQVLRTAKMTLLYGLVVSAIALPAAARQRASGHTTTTTLLTFPTSERGITPTAYPGNFVSSDDDQVCYDLAGLTLIGDVTSEMRGFRIDAGISVNGDVSTIISPDGRSLSWWSDAEVLAFIIKGGPNFHVYDYVGSGFHWDAGLVSPIAKKGIPQISHYNVCYRVPGSGEGCTPGYWRNHGDRWIGVSPSDDFDTTFGVDLFEPNITLGQAIQAGGGGNNALARHATAALLNSYGGVPNGDGTTVDYPYTTVQVIQMVQDAVALGSIEATASTFDAANNLGCPLSGTRSNPI